MAVLSSGCKESFQQAAYVTRELLAFRAICQYSFVLPEFTHAIAVSESLQSSEPCRCRCCSCVGGGARLHAEFYSGSEQLKDVSSPENELFRDQLESVINGAIAELPEDLRTAVTLREYDGLSYEEIAQIMECPVGTVRSRIFRGREAIDARVLAIIDGV